MADWYENLEGDEPGTRRVAGHWWLGDEGDFCLVTYSKDSGHYDSYIANANGSEVGIALIRIISTPPPQDPEEYRYWNTTRATFVVKIVKVIPLNRFFSYLEPKQADDSKVTELLKRSRNSTFQVKYTDDRKTIEITMFDRNNRTPDCSEIWIQQQNFLVFLGYICRILQYKPNSCAVFRNNALILLHFIQ